MKMKIKNLIAKKKSYLWIYCIYHSEMVDIFTTCKWCLVRHPCLKEACWEQLISYVLIISCSPPASRLPSRVEHLSQRWGTSGWSTQTSFISTQTRQTLFNFHGRAVNRLCWLCALARRQQKTPRGGEALILFSVGWRGANPSGLIRAV